MYSELILKEKDDKRVVYYYSLDRVDAPSDGEIECILETKETNTLKTATFDDDGLHAKWVKPYIRWVIFNENCPQKRFIATG